MKRKLGYLGMIMLCIAALGAAFSYGIQKYNTTKVDKTTSIEDTAGEEERLFVTSFYPIYVIAINLTEGIPGVKVQKLTGNQTAFHSLFSGVSGLIFAYYNDTAAGPTIVVIAAVFFFATLVVQKRVK